MQKIIDSFSYLHHWGAHTKVIILRIALPERGGLEKGVTGPCNISASGRCCGCQGCEQLPARIPYNLLLLV